VTVLVPIPDPFRERYNPVEVLRRANVAVLLRFVRKRKGGESWKIGEKRNVPVRGDKNRSEEHNL
jgi:hypothetical protein